MMHQNYIFLACCLTISFGQTFNAAKTQERIPATSTQKPYSTRSVFNRPTTRRSTTIRPYTTRRPSTYFDSYEGRRERNRGRYDDGAGRYVHTHHGRYDPNDRHSWKFSGGDDGKYRRKPDEGKYFHIHNPYIHLDIRGGYYDEKLGRYVHVDNPYIHEIHGDRYIPDPNEIGKYIHIDVPYVHTDTGGGYEGSFDRGSYFGDFDKDSYKGDFDRGGYKGDSDKGTYKGDFDKSGYKGDYDKGTYKGGYNVSPYKDKFDRDSYKDDHDRDKVRDDIDRSKFPLRKDPKSIDKQPSVKNYSQRNDPYAKDKYPYDQSNDTQGQRDPYLKDKYPYRQSNNSATTNRQSNQQISTDSFDKDKYPYKHDKDTDIIKIEHDKQVRTDPYIKDKYSYKQPQDSRILDDEYNEHDEKDNKNKDSGVTRFESNKQDRKYPYEKDRYPYQQPKDTQITDNAPDKHVPTNDILKNKQNKDTGITNIESDKQNRKDAQLLNKPFEKPDITPSRISTSGVPQTPSRKTQNISKKTNVENTTPASVGVITISESAIREPGLANIPITKLSAQTTPPTYFRQKTFEVPVSRKSEILNVPSKSSSRILGVTSKPTRLLGLQTTPVTDLQTLKTLRGKIGPKDAAPRGLDATDTSRSGTPVLTFRKPSVTNIPTSTLDVQKTPSSGLEILRVPEAKNLFPKDLGATDARKAGIPTSAIAKSDIKNLPTKSTSSQLTPSRGLSNQKTTQRPAAIDSKHPVLGAIGVRKLGPPETTLRKPGITYIPSNNFGIQSTPSIDLQTFRNAGAKSTTLKTLGTTSKPKLEIPGTAFGTTRSPSKDINAQTAIPKIPGTPETRRGPGEAIDTPHLKTSEPAFGKPNIPSRNLGTKETLSRGSKPNLGQDLKNADDSNCDCPPGQRNADYLSKPNKNLQITGPNIGLIPILYVPTGKTSFPVANNNYSSDYWYRLFCYIYGNLLANIYSTTHQG